MAGLFSFLSGILLCLFTSKAVAQVTIQARNNSDVLIDSYTFPQGFTNPLDWLITRYANIPSEGITGYLYLPSPRDACTAVQNPCKALNQSKVVIALVDDFHLCTEDKYNNTLMAGFDGLITYSYANEYPEVGRNVFDRSTGLYVDVPAFGLPTVVVSLEFAETLKEQVAGADCQSVIVEITTMGDRQEWVGFAITFAIILLFIGVPLLLIVFICWCICCACIECKKCYKSCCSCCQSHGRYEVNQVHIRVLGDDLILRQPYLDDDEGSYGPGQVTFERFQRVFENERETNARKYKAARERNMSCAICLEYFNEQETVHALKCDDHHVFHPFCIERWLENNSVCPVCRTEVMQPSF